MISSPSILLDGNAFKTDSYEADRTNPSIDKFDLNMSSGVMTLYFSKASDANTFQTNSLILQDNAVGNGYFRLIAAKTSFTHSDNFEIVYVQLLKMVIDYHYYYYHY